MGVVVAAVFIAGSLALGGCVSVPASSKYVEPVTGEPAAVVENWGVVGGATTTCQLPGSSRICRAAVAAVDGKVVPWNANATRIDAGVHSVTLTCMTWQGGPMVLGTPKTVAVVVRGPFDAGRKYYVHCVRTDGTPQVWLAASEDGPALGEFAPESKTP